MSPLSWDDARAAVHAAAESLPPVDLPLADTDGAVLAVPLVALTDLPPFDTSSVDGFAVRGDGPWRLVGRVLAGELADVELASGTAVEIATGAMVPAGTEHVLRIEHTSRSGESVDGPVPAKSDWRPAGDEATAGEVVLPAGALVNPGVIGLAAACGHDTLRVHRRPRVGVVVFGDELLTSGPAGAGHVRDSLGPSLPAWFRRLGAEPGAVRMAEDTLDAHVQAIAAAAEHSDVVATTGGTRFGPVDHLHPAIKELGGEYVVDTVGVRPGFPMLAAQLPGGTWLLGLPGNPQSATIALLTLGIPILAGLVGRPVPPLHRVGLAADVAGRGADTRLALATLGASGAEVLPHVGSSMLRGVAGADGYLVVRPGEPAVAGGSCEFLPLPV